MKQIKKRILDRSKSGSLGDEGTGLKKIESQKIEQDQQVVASLMRWWHKIYE